MVSKLIVYLFFKCVHFYKYNANTKGVIYKKDINYMREKIENLSKEIWDIHSLLLRK